MTIAAIHPTNGMYESSDAVRGEMPFKYCDAGLSGMGCLAPQAAQYTSRSLTGRPHWQQ
jgi:hypothetical protein